MSGFKTYKIAFEYLRSKGIIRNQQHLADLLLINKATISQIINGKLTPPKDFIVKFTTLFKSFNDHWLLTGEGPMLKTDVVDQVGSCTYITPKEVAAELEFVKNQLKEKDKVIGALNQEIGRLKAAIEMFQKEKDCQ